MKKQLLVTLADKKYLEYAKQVFAGAYFNAGWKGDYLLLAHDIPEKDLQWFRKKRILIKHCKPLYKYPLANTPTVFTSKIYLFTPEFKKWSTIIYLDVDTIIRSSLDSLLTTKYFSSVSNVARANLRDELIGVEQSKNLTTSDHLEKIKKIKTDYSFNEKTFCAGFFVFNPKIIRKNTFAEIKKIIDRYYKFAFYIDQLALNLYFYQKWQNLPAVYDFYLPEDQNPWGIPNKNIKGKVLHFIGKSKPWMRKNYFYQEWSESLAKAEMINLSKIPTGKKWKIEEIERYEKYLAKRERIYHFYFKRYLIKQFMKKRYYNLLEICARLFPRLFQILKTSKRRIISKIKPS